MTHFIPHDIAYHHSIVDTRVFLFPHWLTVWDIGGAKFAIILSSDEMSKCDENFR